MRMLFGGLIAVILLGLYVYSVWIGISVVECMSTTGCTSLTVASFTEGMASALSLIGGLVSALVIAELSITKPGEAPGARILDKTSSVAATRAVKIVTGLYLLVWVGAGLSAFVVGYLQHPNVLQPLTDFGKAWFGLAVAAGYAYFGIKP